jgi:hypothetical protein
MLRDALPMGTRIQRATRAQDCGGIDYEYRANYRVPVQVRTRKDRPPFAPDKDITFRTTEPHMIAQATYAPLMLFVWMEKGYAIAGKLVDVYHMAMRISPPLAERPIINNGDGTGFVTVSIGELHDAQALLRQGDRRSWATAVLGGQKRLERILSTWGLSAGRP